MKLTVELIENSPDFVNILGERELDLRANRIPAIENLGVTKDAFETIDLCSNDILRLGNFPRLTKIKALHISNNKINSIDKLIGQQLPNLERLLLANNRLDELHDLLPLASLSASLKNLFLQGNKVCEKPNYRLFVVWHFPHMQTLDFASVKDAERAEAESLFGTIAHPTSFYHAICANKPELPSTFEPGVIFNEATMKSRPKYASKSSQIESAILNAKTYEEIQRLERTLNSGIIPKTS